MKKFFPVFLLLAMILFGFVTINSQTMNSDLDPNSISPIGTGGQGGVIIDADGDWFTFASLPANTSTSGSACAYLNGKVYHFGGSPGPSAEYLEWDEVTNTWTSLGTMPGGANYYYSAETVAGKIYLVGGSTGWPTPTGAVSIFDGSTWTTGTTMPTAVHDIATAVYQNRYIYVIGGMVGSWTDFRNTVQVYDTQSDTWATATNFPIMAGCMSGGCVGNTIVVAGPYNGVASNAIYEGEINAGDPTMITWTTSTGTLPDAVYRVAGGATGGMVFFTGGQMTAGLSSQAVGYNPVTDVVTVYPNKPTPLGNVANFVPGNNMLYFMGGYDGTYNLTCEGMEFTVVPVELTSFTASASDGVVTLNWSTASEINNQGFQIERSSNGVFESVGYVQGFGTSTEYHNYSYVDKNVTAGTYTYRLKQMDYDGTYSYYTSTEVDVIGAQEFALDQNYPNPFNPSTTINYRIPEESFVTLKVYDVLGNEVATLVNEKQAGGFYNLSFNASQLPSGTYIYKLQAGNSIQTKKMLLLK